MKILFATGGSGGHIFPALKTAERLKSEGHEVTFAGALTSAEDRLQREGFECIVLNVEGFKKKTPAGIFSFGRSMVKGVQRSLEIMRSLKPDVVVGFGGYSSFPLVCAASLSHIPAMLHEQNVMPGKANKLSAKFVRRVAVSFERTGKSFKGREVIWTGCPCNAGRPSGSRNSLIKHFNFHPDRLTILVLGGSQGSKRLNEVFFEMISDPSTAGYIQVIHATGKDDYAAYTEKYQSLNIPHHVRAFVDNIKDAYAAADIVVARSGAATVCELAAFGLPSVLVPYPFAHGHQIANARVLEEAGVASIIEQKDLSAQKLAEAVRLFRDQKLSAFTVRERLKHLFVDDSVQRLARAVTSLK